MKLLSIVELAKTRIVIPEIAGSSPAGRPKHREEYGSTMVVRRSPKPEMLVQFQPAVPV